jgi:cytochrome c oxidase subunit 1
VNERTTILTWLTTTDHKRIGLLYLTAAFGFFLLGGLLALVIRSELAVPGLQLTDQEGYNQLFTMHGTIMMLLFATPAVAGLANFLIPLQVGAADMVFPRLNALSFWLFLFGGLIVISGYLAAGGPADVGWTGYPPNSELPYSTTIGTDLWIVGLALTGIASVFGAINFVATTYTRRAPGMSMLRVPVFTWTVLVTAVLILFAFPGADRSAGDAPARPPLRHAFFDPSEGGSAILWQHLFWFFGHPEVYIVALPFFGVISEIIPVFSRKPLFGYRFLIIATILIGAYSMTVWAHHMFTTGAVSLPFFSIATVHHRGPTGIKFFNWIGTMWRGSSRSRPRCCGRRLPVTFLFGGLTGVILASPPLDFHLQTRTSSSPTSTRARRRSVFALFAAIYFWFPKMTGRRLSEPLGKLHFWSWIIGFTLAFFVQYQLGAQGMMRRYADYPPDAGFTTLNVVSTAGALLLGFGTLPFLLAVVLALRRPRTSRLIRGVPTHWSGQRPPRHRTTTSRRSR